MQRRENKKMSFTDIFGNPKGLLGRMMLVSIEREHLPMAKWAFPQLHVPEKKNTKSLMTDR